MDAAKIMRLLVVIGFLALNVGGAGSVQAAINQNAPVTANFQNSELREALQTLAAAGQAKIMVNANVTARVSARFTNTPFKDALQTLLSQTRLVSRSAEDTIYVALPGELPDIKETPPQNSTIEGPQVIKLKYVKAEQIKTALSGVVPEDRLRIEASHNALIFTGGADEYATLDRLLKELDVPPRQVMFEAEVVEMSKSNVSDFGVNWLWSSYPSPAGSTLLGVIKEVDSKRNYNITYQATLNALVTLKKAKILANPRVAALDGETAYIMIGDRLPVETKFLANGVQQVSVSYVDVGIKLRVTPWVNEDGIITTKLKPEVSTNIATDGNNPSIRTREAETTLRVRDGETIVLGGLIQNEDRKTITKIPLLGDLPLIGRLFKDTGKEKRETELIIFITPKIIK